MMKRFTALYALVAGVALAAASPVFAADSFVQDGASMFSPATTAELEQHIGAFHSATGKDVVVVTVPSLGGATLQDAAHAAFAQHDVNGVLIFIAKDDRRDIIVPDRAGVQAGWFDADTLAGIRQGMEAQFKAEDFDGGITSAVNGVLGIYRSHSGSLPSHAGAMQQTAPPPAQPTRGGPGLFVWLIIALIGYLIVRSLIRAASAPRPGVPMQPGAPGQPNQPVPMGMPMQGGWGGGYGGGGFWSGLLGGLGGAFLGNEIFGNRGGGGNFIGGDQGMTPGGALGPAPDAGGWSNDAGQADMGGASSGGWGGGGFGDGGGFGGGDGGGGGDSGGGW